MKKTANLICAVLMIGTACSKENVNVQDDSLCAVSFRSNITLTTKVTDTSWESNDRIGIFMVPADGVAETGSSSNRKYCPSSSDNSLAPDGDANTLYFPKDGSSVNFYAYCPYTELDGTILPLDLSDQSSQSAIDLVYAANTEGKSKNTPDVLLSFSHKLSKIALDVTMGNGSDTEELSCTIYGMNTRSDFNLLTEEYGESSSIQPIIPFRQGNHFEAILLPCKLAESSYIEFSSTEGTYRWEISNDISELSAGNKYIWQITLTPEAAVPAVTKGVISDWECTQGSSSIGIKPAVSYKAGDYYPDPDVDVADAEAVKKIEGIVFSSNGTHGKILSLTESSGLKWNIDGAKDGTLDENNGTANWNTIKAKDASFANYPAFAWCASLGDGWYIPAINELIEIRTAWGSTIEEKEAFNKRISDIGGEPIKATTLVEGSAKSAYYYSSTEKESATNKALSLSFNGTSGASDGIKKSSDGAANLIFRAIRRF